jgi:hypothetical protein
MGQRRGRRACHAAGIQVSNVKIANVRRAFGPSRSRQRTGRTPDSTGRHRLGAEQVQAVEDGLAAIGTGLGGIEILDTPTRQPRRRARWS